MPPSPSNDPDEAARLTESILAWWRAAGVDAPTVTPPRRPGAGAAKAVEKAPPGASPDGPGAAPSREATAPPSARGGGASTPPRRTFTDQIQSRKAPAASSAARAGRRAPAPPPKGGKADAATGADAPPAEDAAEAARTLAAKADTLEALRAALEGFTAHPLHASARNTVFARGDPAARVMVVGEAPGREEDAQGLPFVGRSGKLLDAMFAAIGLSAAPQEGQQGLYITNILNWRPPGNRNPSSDEIALCEPFIARHIALVAPALLVVAGGVAAQTLLQTRQGIMRLRGRWSTYGLPDGRAIPVLPMYHPAFILRRPIAKRDAWADLLALQERLEDGG